MSDAPPPGPAPAPDALVFDGTTARPLREVVEAARNVKLTADGIYPDRNCMHKNMGPPELFPCCGGRGYFPGGSEDSPNDSYCKCAAGDERRRTDGG